MRLFLPTLLHQVHFEAAPAGAAVVAALEYLKRREAPARAQDVAPSAVVTTAWRRYVYGAKRRGRSPGLHLLRPRPTARGAAPAGCLRDAELAVCRSAAQSPGWRRVGGGAADHVSNAWLQSSPRTDPCRVKRRAGSDLPRGGRAPPQQSSVRFERIDGKGELIVSPLDKVEEPASLVAAADRHRGTVAPCRSAGDPASRSRRVQISSSRLRTSANARRGSRILASASAPCCWRKPATPASSHSCATRLRACGAIACPGQPELPARRDLARGERAPRRGANRDPLARAWGGGGAFPISRSSV